MIKKLGEIGQIKVPRRIKYSEGTKYNIVDVTAINVYDLYRTGYKKTDNRTNLLEKDDIVIVSFDYTGHALGYSFYIDKKNTYVAGIDTIILTDCTINSKALSAYLSRNEIKKQFLKYSNLAITTSKRISPSLLSEIEIDLDKVKEIEKYLNAVNEIDNLLFNAYQSLTELEILRKEAAKRIFKEIEGCESKNITEICNISYGAPQKPERISERKTAKDKYPVLGSVGAVIGYTDKSNSPKNYVLYNSRGGGIGDSCTYNEKAYTINKAFMLETNSVNLDFLAYQLSFYKPGIEGSGPIRFISVDSMKKINVFIPDKAKQEKIVKCLNAFKDNVKQRKEYMENLLLLRKTLINQ